MSRPRKFDDGAFHVGFRADAKIVKEAHRRAENQGTTLSDVLQSFLRSYVGVNSTLSELEVKRAEVQKRFEQAKIELGAINAAIESQRSRISDDHVRYFMRQDKAWTEERRETWLKRAAENAGVPLDEYRRMMDERVEELKEAD